MPVGPILPATDDPDSAGFWAATREGKFVVQKCGGCGELRFPPRPFCKYCQSNDFSWHPVSGRGRIWSFAIAHKPVYPALADFAPFPIVIVELEEKPTLRISGNVLAAPGAAINSVDPAKLRIGQPVHVTFQQVAEDVVLPQWLLTPPPGAA